MTQYTVIPSALSPSKARSVAIQAPQQNMELQTTRAAVDVFSSLPLLGAAAMLRRVRAIIHATTSRGRISRWRVSIDRTRRNRM